MHKAIRPFQGVIKDRQAGYFLFWGIGVALLLSFMLGPPGMAVTLKAWVKPSIWTKHLSQGPSSWSQGSEQKSALPPPLATLPWAILPLTQFPSHCPSPTSSAPVYTILKGSTQRTGSLHNCYLKHINQNAYFISLYSFKQFILILILIKTKIWGKGTIEYQGHIWPIL